MSFNRLRLASIIAAGFAALLCSQPANAQSDHTFLSVHGVDSPTCGAIDSPCRTFNVAITNTNPKGEVIAIDSGVYVNPDIVISKSITLTAAPGTHVELRGTDLKSEVVTVNLSGDTNVTLRNLSVSGLQQFGGIQVLGSSGTVSIENCVVSGTTGYGISFETSGTVQSFIRDTTITDSNYGLVFRPSAGLLKASVEHCRFERNTEIGVDVFSFCRVTVGESVSSGNGTGFLLQGGSDLNLDRCEASNNTSGVTVQDDLGGGSRTGVVTISNSIVTNNSDFGLMLVSGAIQSAGNNIVRRNGTNTSGTITVIAGT
jgi:parallel beta helix pectate lyase-like protein